MTAVVTATYEVRRLAEFTYAVLRDGVRIGALHGNADSATSAALLAQYQESQGYPPREVAALAATV